MITFSRAKTGLCSAIVVVVVVSSRERTLLPLKVLLSIYLSFSFSLVRDRVDRSKPRKCPTTVVYATHR